MRAATAASLISPNVGSATPLYYLGMSASVNSRLILRLRQSSPKAPRKISLPLSDRTVMTVDVVPSARTSARNDSNSLAASDLCLRKYTQVNRVKSSRTTSVYRFPPILCTVIGPLRPTETLSGFLAALVCVDLAMSFRSPFGIEHPRHS